MIYFLFIISFLITLIGLFIVPKWDPRWESTQVFSKGLIIFLTGIALIVSANNVDITSVNQIIKTVGYIICIPGFAIMALGQVKNIQGILKPVDPKRVADPGYDLEYIQCPFCKQAKMRKERKVVKCPICKKKTRIENF